VRGREGTTRQGFPEGESLGNRGKVLKKYPSGMGGKGRKVTVNTSVGQEDESVKEYTEPAAVARACRGSSTCSFRGPCGSRRGLGRKSIRRRERGGNGRKNT